MSLVSAFVLVWVAVIAAWLILDWLGNPNRGSFRPQSDRVDRERVPRREKRALRRDREDATVRTVLRDRYGRSSLRLHWSDDEEASAVDADQDLVTKSFSAAGLDRLAGEPPVESDDKVELYDGWADDAEILLTEDDKEPETEPPDDAEEIEVADEQQPEPTPAGAARRAGWTIGDEPLAPTRSGNTPTATTVRARVWKNLAAVADDDANWDDDNRERMRSGKAPRRRNPVTGRPELAVVDTDTGNASWPDTALDPFGDDDR